MGLGWWFVVFVCWGGCGCGVGVLFGGFVVVVVVVVGGFLLLSLL